MKFVSKRKKSMVVRPGLVLVLRGKKVRAAATFKQPADDRRTEPVPINGPFTRA